METSLTPEAKTNRTRGRLLIVLGLMLSLGMAGISFYLWRTIHYPGQSGSTSRWTGSAEMTARTFQFFGTIFAFGLVCLATGVFQVKTGRRNMIAVALLLLLVGLMIFLGNQIMQLQR
jgi:MFS family permease